MQTVDLIKFLNENGSVSVDELSRVFHASVRTVRAHVHEANEALAGMATVAFSRVSRGYRLNVEDATAFEAWLSRNAGLAARANRSASEERVTYLLNDLLSRADWVTIGDLSSILYVSSQSISADLKQVENVLGRFGLNLVKRPRYGVRVEGSEMARRLCLASVVSRTLVDNGAIADNDDVELSQTVESIGATIGDIVRSANFTISATAFQNLVIHVVVALSRIREHALVPMSEEHLASLRGADEYPLAVRIAKAIGVQTGVEMPETEVAYIAIHLAGKKTLAAFASAGSNAAAENAAGADIDSDQGDAESAVIPEEIWNLVNAMLERVWESFRFDFRDDLELHMNLARHLVPLATRLEYHLRIENPLLSDIKTRFPLAYSMGVEASSVVAERYAATMSEDEMGYIALAFALALDRQKTAAPKKNVLVVCASGVGTTRLLKQSVMRQFGDRIGTLSVCDAFHVADQDFSSIDYVFTTVPIEEPVPVPVQRINVFLDEGDVQSINALFERSAKAGDLLRRLFDPQLFVAHLATTGREAALRELSARTIELAGVDPQLTDLVLQRERTAPTAFGNSIALPHPIRPIAAATRVCVGLLDEPIDWGGKQVQMVMLVAFGTEDHEALDFFFSGAAALLSDEPAVARILRERTFDSFIDAFSRVSHDGHR